MPKLPENLPRLDMRDATQIDKFVVTNAWVGLDEPSLKSLDLIVTRYPDLTRSDAIRYALQFMACAIAERK